MNRQMTVDYQVTRSEVKKLSLEFRRIASQLLTTAHEDGINNLRRFIKFIESNPLIYDFLLKNQVKEFTFSASRVWGSRYELPDTKEEEISYVYQLLKYGLENFSDYASFPFSAGGYSGSKIQTQVDEFNKTIVRSFVNQIEGYLNSLLIDLGDEERNTIHVQIESLNGSFIAPNHSINQNNNFSGASIGGGVAGRDVNGDVNIINNYPENPNKDEVLKLLEILREELLKTGTDNQDITTESLDIIKEEITTPTKPSRVKMALFALWSVGKDFITVVNALTAISERFEIQLPGSH